MINKGKRPYERGCTETNVQRSPPGKDYWSGFITRRGGEKTESKSKDVVRVLVDRKNT